MKSLIRLELRKQSKTFLGLLFIIVMCLTLVTASISAFVGLQLGETFLSITVMLQAFGIPFFALLLGAGAGSALKSVDRKAEEDIPIRFTKRVFAAYLTSLFYLIILGVILFLAGRPFQYSSYLQQDYKILFVVLALLPLHSAAFVFSYWLGQALLGSVVSVISTAAPMYLLVINHYSPSTCCQSSIDNFLVVIAFYFFPCLIYQHLEWILMTSLVAPAFLTTVANLIVLAWLAKRIERENKIWLPMKIAIAALLISGFLLGVWVINYAGAIFPVTEKDIYEMYYLGDCKDYVR
jgi:hypothetical protein